MSDFKEMPADEFYAAYEAAEHAVQTGVAFMLSRECPQVEQTILKQLKHMKTGVNLERSDQGALTKLLIDKGVITLRRSFSARLSNRSRPDMPAQGLSYLRRRLSPARVRRACVVTMSAWRQPPPVACWMA